MSDSAATLKSGEKPKKQVSEARIWLGAFAGMTAAVAVATVCGLYAGNDFVSAATGTAGAALGTLLAGGGYHLVSRRPEDGFTIVGMGWLVAEAGDKHRTFAVSFIGSLIIAGIAFSILGVLKRFMRQTRSCRSKKAPPPQSDHLLYDVEVDGAT